MPEWQPGLDHCAQWHRPAAPGGLAAAAGQSGPARCLPRTRAGLRGTKL